MTRHRLRIQQFALTIRSTLHTRIIANNQRKQADRRAGLFRAFLGAVVEAPAVDVSADPRGCDNVADLLSELR